CFGQLSLLGVLNFSHHELDNIRTHWQSLEANMWNNSKYWYEKPVGIVLLNVISGLIVFGLSYLLF
ncbi:hypothetical protein, partial [Vibrio parahaemolyticus]|uniref:hypothetical protein n=1 Tax=Vibrio parahaemolyticus TaxID=670 RepID=UPI001D16BFCF